MYRMFRIERLEMARRVGRRGLLLILSGLAWVGIGISLVAEPRDRFSSPGMGTDTTLQVLDSPVFNYVWIVAGVIALFTGIFRDRRIMHNHDAIGFNAVLTPPLMVTLFFAWSFAVYLATNGREGQFGSLFAFIIYSFISLFIMVVAGWPEAYATNAPPLKPELEEEK